MDVIKTGKITDILLNGRMQTAGETTVGMAVGYVAFIPNPNLIVLFFVMMLGLVYHGIGFSWNNLLDLKYDKLDPKKQDLPLVAGRLNHSNVTIALVFFTTFVLGLVIIYTIFAQNVMADVFFLMAVFGGFYYDSTNKETNLGQIGIIIAFPSMVMFAFLLDHPLNMLGAMVFLYSLLTISFLNLFSGQLKDISVKGQVNFLRFMGSNENGISIPAIVMGTLIKLSALIVMVWADSIPGIILAYASLQLSVFMLIKWPNISYRMQQIDAVIIELTAAIAFIVAFVLSPYLILILIIYPILWLIGFNRLFFHTTLHMKV